MSRPIYTYAYARVAFDDAIALLAGDPEWLLQDATDVSAADADSIVGNLHVTVAGRELDREVAIELGEFDPVEVLRSVVPVRWRATRGQMWFPTMDATLEVTALSLRPPLVQVTLAGSYEPPFGVVGAVFDAVAAHRIAEATAHTFVNEVANRLEELVAQAADPSRCPGSSVASPRAATPVRSRSRTRLDDQTWRIRTRQPVTRPRPGSTRWRWPPTTTGARRSSRA